jgi:DNA polymerase III gamma/tau subunit
MHVVPDSLPVTDVARERLREMANQLPATRVVRLIDLLAVAVDDMRQGGDPRLPLELALVKVTRPASDLSRESLAYRLEKLEQQRPSSGEAPTPAVAAARDDAAPEPEPEQGTPEPLRVELEQLQEAWRRTILPAVEQRSIPIGKTLSEAHPAALAGDTLTLEFPASASFHRGIAEEPKNATALAEALHEVTGRRLGVAFEVGEAAAQAPSGHEPVSEDELYELMKETFDAREVGGE